MIELRKEREKNKGFENYFENIKLHIAPLHNTNRRETYQAQATLYSHPAEDAIYKNQRMTIWK